MPNTGAGEQLTIPVQTRIDETTNRRFDEWRRRQEKIPGVSEALRQLLQKALSAEQS
jgi:hypothetical protein